jgi:large subunit ribosomal protein L22
MEVRAQLKFARIGTQKARLVADTVRGKNVNEALKTLAFMPKKGADLILKLLESGVANAEQKKVIDIDNLYVKTIEVNKGPHIKRSRPRGKGSASQILKKMSHISITLDEQ